MSTRKDSEAPSPPSPAKSQHRHESGPSDARVGGSAHKRPPKQKPKHLQKAAHKPNTAAEEECVYVLTLKTSDEIAVPINQLRETWFPKKLNRTPAHLTYFHALPHSQLNTMEEKLASIASRFQPFQVAAAEPFQMRRGVGINMGVGAKEAKSLHEQMRGAWMDFLSEQDKGGFKPHWTVMNKEDDEKRVDDALQEVKKELESDRKDGLAVGLELWRYDHGNWVWHNEFLFVGEANLQERLTDAGQGQPDAPEPGPQGRKQARMKRMWRSMSFQKG